VKKLFLLLFLFTACGQDLSYISQRNSNNSTPTIVKVLSFDGVDEYLTLADHADFNFGTTLSLFLWVKASSASLSLNETIWSQSDIVLNQRAFLVRVAGDTTKFKVLISEDGGVAAPNIKEYTTSINVFDDSWHLIGFTWNSGTFKFYVDGVEDTSVVKNTDGAITSIHNSTANMTFSCSLTTGAPRTFFNGQLDEPALWNSELSSGQVSALYNSGTPVDLKTHSASGNLVSWWRLGDDSSDDIGTTNTLVDVQSSHDATPTNMEAGDIVDRTVP
jgi:hypothetical protein